MWAIDLAEGKMWAGVNGTWYGSGNPATGANPTVSGITNTRKIFQVELDGGAGNRSSVELNFGQKPFVYAPPSGFKSFNTKTLADADNKRFSPVVNTFVNNTDLVWIKNRSAISNNAWYDSVRGPRSHLSSNLQNGAETPNVGTGLGTFAPNGFSLGREIAGTTGSGSTNANGSNYVAWCWNRGRLPGFDIVSYRGTGDTQIINHNLGVAPKFMIFKATTGTGHWAVYHENMNNGSGDPTFGYINLNLTGGFNLEAAGSSRTRWWDNKRPTPTNFTIGAGTADQLNVSGTSYIGYLFAEVPGFSKISYFTGNGSSDGPFIYTGFRPRWIMMKRTDATTDPSWVIYDTVRGTFNGGVPGLFAQTTGAESSTTVMDILANGFKMRNGDGTVNGSGGTYIYVAFAENPLKYANAR